MKSFARSGNREEIALGESLIRQGKVGSIVLAGGDGSRLGWSGPKGTFPITPNKTLFQLLSERVRAASSLYNVDLSIAVMTSPLNDAATRDSFPQHLPPVDFFTQKMAQLLDEKKLPLSEERPNGNGEALHQFYASGLYEKWAKLGIEYLQVIPIDNLLAAPFDPNLIGFQAKRELEVALKAIERKDPEEKVGVVGMRGGKLCVIEYSEHPPAEWNVANTGLFSFSMSFVREAIKISLPIHLAKKEVNGAFVYKQELFLFDLLPFANRVDALIYPREEIFAPLKSKEDVKGILEALSNYRSLPKA